MLPVKIKGEKGWVAFGFGPKLKERIGNCFQIFQKLKWIDSNGI
jgi:hypothetical protein